MGLWGFLNPHLNDPRSDAKRLLVNNWLDNVEPFDEDEEVFYTSEQSDSESESEPEPDLPPAIQYSTSVMPPALRSYDLSAVSFSPWRNAGDSAIQSPTPYAYAAPQGNPQFSYSRRLEPVPYPTWNDDGIVQGGESEEESEEESEVDEDEDENENEVGE